MIVQTTVVIDSSLYLFTLRITTGWPTLRIIHTAIPAWQLPTSGEGICYVELLSAHTKFRRLVSHPSSHVLVPCAVFCTAVSCPCSGWHSTGEGFDPDCSRHAAALLVSPIPEFTQVVLQIRIKC